MSDEKKRHGCLTAWLILMIIANAATAFLYFTGGALVAAAVPSGNSALILVLGVIGLANVAFAIALFMWKKWAFWGFCGCSVITMIINIILGLGIGQSVGGLLGAAILYGVLQIGGDNKGWDQLS